MKNKPTTRTEATRPEAVEHLGKGEKEALDLHGEAEHADGDAREELTRTIEQLADPEDQSSSERKPSGRGQG
ncbi:MAG: hypothetical protein ABI680_13915 [Chthoniobacteraceae bacterium]